MKIVFVRHGEPDYEHDCLTDEGRKQAAGVAKRLAGYNIERIYSSPMGRALETASYTAYEIGIPKDEIIQLDYMHELIWGSLDREEVYQDGHPWTIADEMVERNMDLLDHEWPSNEYFINNRVTEYVMKTSAGIDTLLKDLGYEREGLYYRNVRENDEQFTVALFSHGGSSSAALAHVLNMTFPYVCATIHSPFTGITTLRFDTHPGSISVPCIEYMD
ncbi:MAG: histidine phosphatase family protein [Lachnospiraceae bacterium]|nr:histidine phosphatase family protein [Lachnospiraceae bacterium]